MTALETARRSGQAKPHRRGGEAQPELPATLGKAGAWARWMARRESDTTPTAPALTPAGEPTA